MKIIDRFHRKRSGLLNTIILVLTSAAALGALLLPISSRPDSFQIQVGAVAQQDIQAPREISYISDVLTEEKIDNIVDSIEPVYLPIDPAISRHQIDRLRKSLDFITIVRSDTYADQNEKINDLGQIEDISLSKDQANSILTLPDDTWQAIQREAITVLEQSLRNNIRESQIADYQRRIPSLISYSFPEEQAQIITALTSPFIVANSLFSEDLTQQKIDEALANADKVTISFATGESIVRRGEIIDKVAYEALEKYNLVSPSNQDGETIAAVIIIIVITFLLGIYFNKRKSSFQKNVREILVISVSLVIFLFAAKFLIPNRTILPYIFPVAGFAFAISSLFGFETSAVLTIVLTGLITYDMPDSQTLFIYYMFPAMIGTLVLGQGRRISIFFGAGAIAGLVGAGVVLSTRLITTGTDWVGIVTLTLASIFNGMASALLGLLLQFIVAQILGITTAIQLLEIARPDHPLLQFILKNAPGTYQHALQVSNLAEQAAKDIGADQLLTRVGGIYHDAGKALNPTFYIENQVSGILNPHDDLDPYVSARTVIQHVKDGVELAKKYHLPKRIQDFMLEHHGTLTTRYFYVKAMEQNNNDKNLVNEDDFRYPGPIPQSKETALLMLADGTEAKARAEKPSTREELRAIAQNVVDFCQREGQLEDTDLTMKDLNIIVDSFTDTLINTYHPRIRYPELKTQPREA